MMVQDKELQEIYCAWAESKLGKHVEEVRFKQWDDTGYSEYTPGEGATIDVDAKVDGKWRYLEGYSGNNLIDLTRELTRFAYNYYPGVYK